MNEQPRTEDMAEDPDTRPPDDAPADNTPERRSRRRIVVPLVLLVVLGTASAFGYRWWTVERFVESTDDAYLKTDIVGIAPQVAGIVASIDVQDNQHVKKGDVLLRLDDDQYRASVAKAAAAVAGAHAALANLAQRQRLQASRIDAARADVAEAGSELQFARTDDARARALRRTGSGTARNAQLAQTNLKSAKARLAKATATLETETQQLAVLNSERKERDADLMTAEADLRLARIDLDRTVVRAPGDGVVANRGVDVGSYVKIGTHVMSLVPLHGIYVIANFKETQIERFRDGMKANVSIDMLGGKDLRGRIQSLAPASGSEFAILPAENATGNFTKVVQRLPVKIRLDDPDAAPVPLRAGMSVTVSIDTKAQRR